MLAFRVGGDTENPRPCSFSRGLSETTKIHSLPENAPVLAVSMLPESVWNLHNPRYMWRLQIRQSSAFNESVFFPLKTSMTLLILEEWVSVVRNTERVKQWGRGSRSLEGVKQNFCSWKFGFHVHQGGKEEDTESGRQARLWGIPLPQICFFPQSQPLWPLSRRGCGPSKKRERVPNRWPDQTPLTHSIVPIPGCFSHLGLALGVNPQGLWIMDPFAGKGSAIDRQVQELEQW